MSKNTFTIEDFNYLIEHSDSFRRSWKQLENQTSWVALQSEEFQREFEKQLRDKIKENEKK